MRTNIVINEELFGEAARYAQGKTRRAVIDEALRTFVEVKASERRATTYRERVRDLDARLSTLRLRQGPAELLREDRNRT
jgi:Arc/MetJ family transcription regulator